MCNRPATEAAQPRCPAGRPSGMRLPMRCAPGKTLLLAAWAVMAVAGCAATHTTTGPVTATSRTAASPTARERAVAEAAAILRAFVVPPGGHRLPKAPDVLKVPSSTLVSTTLVDDVLLLAGARSAAGGTGLGAGAPAPPFHARGRRFRAAVMGPHVLAISDSRRAERPRPGGRGGRSGQRADRDPGGRPGELAAAPAGPRTGAGRRPRSHDHPTAQPGPARQPSARAGHDHRPGCHPAARGARRQPPAVHDRTGRLLPDAPRRRDPADVPRRAGGPLLAVAQGPAACGTVQFSAGGKRQPALQITDSFIPQVLKLADLTWKVP